MTRWKLGFLASHRGTNMQAIIDACRDGRLAAEPAVVISNNGASGALDRAATAGIPAYHIGSANVPDPEERDQAIVDTLRRHGVDLVVLAGYMQKVGPRTLAAFPDRIINIHPALLPKHGGRGMYGLNVHRAVIEAGERETGITIHLVNGEYDAGRILAQRRVPVQAGDTPESLAERMLPLEHELYVDTLKAILEGKIALGQDNPKGRE